MAKMVSLRVPEDLLEWADGYAATRNVSRTDLLVEGLRSFREDCERGVPEIRAAAAAQSSVRSQEGVGVCPKNAGGHVWKSPSEDPLRSCVHCGRHGREASVRGERDGGFLAEATSGRAEFFSRLRPPMQSGTGKAPGSKAAS